MDVFTCVSFIDRTAKNSDSLISIAIDVNLVEGRFQFNSVALRIRPGADVSN